MTCQATLTFPVFYTFLGFEFEFKTFLHLFHGKWGGGINFNSSRMEQELSNEMMGEQFEEQEVQQRLL